MIVVIIKKDFWNMQTIENVTSITYSSGSITVSGDVDVTVSTSDYLVRIMG